jgi:hypothetical protein
MRPISISIGFGLFAICAVGLTGCSKGKTNSPPSGQAVVAPHQHHHGHALGPHAGYVIGFDIEDIHAELIFDVKANRIGVYILGEDAATAIPIDAKSVAIKVTVDNKPTDYALPAVAQPTDPAGKSSYFEVVSEPLFAVFAGKSGSQYPDIQLSATFNGKSHLADIYTQDMSGPAPAGSQGNAAGDALLWIKVLKEQGYDISLGHHGVALLAGSKVEPAVQITRDGKPIADAKVFNALFQADGRTVLAEEVATVYEPPSSDEPSHYAQGALKIPPGTREAMLRFRIILPEVKEEKTYDVPVTVK